MPLAYKQLAQSQLTTASGAFYTSPAGTQTIIKQLRIVNTDTVPRWVKLGNNGGADANLILPQTTIAAGGWAEFDGTLTLAAGETIVAQAEVASKLTMTAHGAQVT